MITEINKSITDCFVGKDEVVKSLLTCLLAGGHGTHLDLLFLSTSHPLFLERFHL